MRRQPDGPGGRAGPGFAVLRLLARGEQILGSALVVLVFALMLIQALQRYLPMDSWTWAGELARFSLVWLTFAVAGYLMGRDSHITLKLIDHSVPAGALRFVEVVANLVVAAVCAGFAYEAVELLQLPPLQTSPGLGMPVKWLYVIPLIGLVLTAIRALVAIVAPGAGNGDPAGEQAGDGAGGQAG
ncbi:TRAP-type C4-dicarboxylate transport system, small permease component [Haloechinothrix alba]|uniref:TRAP-type C4-dicarboxylate transport system, small permease component n=1 Tax=Haloechinothrix alba TaxID=664784 RepID=A0A238VPW1_9PSEU|nr:TRAP transporter small permease subunit [Haloechinothrix alba]SNR36410.1 TRAP-type C4-dicarboxylate transport system, small permease component [Haloechinothrix alba]